MPVARDLPLSSRRTLPHLALILGLLLAGAATALSAQIAENKASSGDPSTKSGPGRAPAAASATSPTVQRHDGFQSSPRRKQWRFLVYMNADNDLEAEAMVDFLELAQTGSTAEVDIVVQLDRITGYNKDYGNWKDTRRFHVTQSLTPDPGSELANLGERNMGKGVMKKEGDGSLEDFVCWAHRRFPAERTALVLWDHGDGWRTQKLSFKSAGEDWTNNDLLHMAEVREALENSAAAGCPVDVIGFDSCLMGMLEVAYEVASVAPVMLASEKMVPGTGWPYDLIIADLAADPFIDARALGEMIVRDYAVAEPNETIAALDLSAVPALAEAVTALALTLDSLKPDIVSVRDLVRDYGTGGARNHVDLHDLADRFTIQFAAGAIHDAAQAVLDAFPLVVIANHGKPGKDHGIALYYPELASKLSEDYNGDIIVFAHDGNWDDFLRWYHEISWLYALGQATPGGTIEFRVVGAPAAPVMLYLGTGVQKPPQPTPYGWVYIEQPPLAAIPLGPIPTDGLLKSLQTLPAFWQLGEEKPFQALVGPPGHSTSELSNLLRLILVPADSR